MSEIAACLVSEIEPPPEGKQRKKQPPQNKMVPKRGPPRPYRKIPEEVLTTRLKRLTDRIDKIKKQHESTRVLLTRYSHERYYRDKEAIKNAQEDVLPSHPPLDE
jgi:hypothetical protein